MFVDPSAYPFIGALAAGCDAVQRELHALDEDALRPWHDRHLYDGASWRVFGLYAFGRKLADNCRRCPATTRLVESVPGMLSAGFSRLEPGAHIRPHRGLARGVYRCHLGLQVPAGCELRVASETRSWKEGECLVFDDTAEHEAWNRSGSERVVLLVDFERQPGRRRLQHVVANRIDGLRFALFNRFAS